MYSVLVPKLEKMQVEAVIREGDARGVHVFFRKLQCSHADFTKVAGTIRSSMFAACALALVTSDHTTRGRLWAAGQEILVRVYCNISSRYIRTLEGDGTNFAIEAMDQ